MLRRAGDAEGVDCLIRDQRGGAFEVAFRDRRDDGLLIYRDAAIPDVLREELVSHHKGKFVANRIDRLTRIVGCSKEDVSGATQRSRVATFLRGALGAQGE